MLTRKIVRYSAYGFLIILFLAYFAALLTGSVRWSLFLVSISPVFIIFFVYVVLRYEKPSTKEFKDGSWYEDQQIEGGE